MSETKKERIVGKTVLVILGIICVVLTAGLIGTITVYSSIIRDKNSSISSLNSKIASLNSQVSSLDSKVTSLQGQVGLLQEQVDGLLNASATSVTVEELSLNLSAWLDKTVAVEGNLTGAYLYAGYFVLPYDYELSSNGITIYVFSLVGPSEDIHQGVKALVLGVVRQRHAYGIMFGGRIIIGPAWYVIEAQKVYLL